MGLPGRGRDPALLEELLEEGEYQRAISRAAQLAPAEAEHFVPGEAQTAVLWASRTSTTLWP